MIQKVSVNHSYNHGLAFASHNVCPPKTRMHHWNLACKKMVAYHGRNSHYYKIA